MILFKEVASLIIGPEYSTSELVFVMKGKIVYTIKMNAVEKIAVL